MFREPFSAGEFVLQVRNDGTHALQRLATRAAGCTGWGPNRLASPLRPGALVEVVLESRESVYDVLAAYADGREDVLTAVDVRAFAVILRY